MIDKLYTIEITYLIDIYVFKNIHKQVKKHDIKKIVNNYNNVIKYIVKEEELEENK